MWLRVMLLFPLVSEEAGVQKAFLNFVPDWLSLLGKVEALQPDTVSVAFFTFSIQTVLWLDLYVALWYMTLPQEDFFESDAEMDTCTQGVFQEPTP